MLKRITDDFLHDRVTALVGVNRIDEVLATLIMQRGIEIGQLAFLRSAIST